MCIRPRCSALAVTLECVENSCKYRRGVMGNHLGQHAVVIGGSLAGLMTARVLADRFDAVTMLERDHIDTRPSLHQSIPHGNHLHVLLLGGQQVMASLYPGFIDTLERLGGVRIQV